MLFYCSFNSHFCNLIIINSKALNNLLFSMHKLYNENNLNDFFKKKKRLFKVPTLQERTFFLCFFCLKKYLLLNSNDNSRYLLQLRVTSSQASRHKNNINFSKIQIKNSEEFLLRRCLSV